MTYISRMRYAVIMAGGSGTRLWPMSRGRQPKQLIPFIKGKSLLQLAVDRLDGLVPIDGQYICAGQTHRDAILGAVVPSSPDRYLAEPTGRDTLNAVGFAAAVIATYDPDAVMAILTADHIIEPVDQFQSIIAKGFDLAEAQPNTLITFGIEPTHPATGYGYLQLGDAIDDNARVVEQFREKPDAPTALRYLGAGPAKYLWNSGMFVWRAATLLDCIKRYEPSNYDGLMRIADAWSDQNKREAVLAEVYPTLKKISVDFAVMEPASADSTVQVAAVPMPLAWADVGSWPAFAKTCPTDEHGNANGGGKQLLVDCSNTLIASNDPNHIVTALGVEDLLIIHTPDATLVCRTDSAEDIKKVHQIIGERYGDALM